MGQDLLTALALVLIIEGLLPLLAPAAWQKAMRAGAHDMRYVNGTHSTADIAYWFLCESKPYPNQGESILHQYLL